MGMDTLKAYALCFVGLPYRWGGDDPIDGFDCSGFVQELLASEGMDPPGDQTAQGLCDYFASTQRATSDATCGALAFYGKGPREITHVAMLLDESHIIEAGGGGSRTIDRAAAAAQNAFIRVRPIRARKDLVAIVRPKYGQPGAAQT